MANFANDLRNELFLLIFYDDRTHLTHQQRFVNMIGNLLGRNFGSLIPVDYFGSFLFEKFFADTLQIIGTNCKSDIAFEMFIATVRTSVKSMVLQFINVGFNRTMFVSKFFEDFLTFFFAF